MWSDHHTLRYLYGDLIVWNSGEYRMPGNGICITHIKKLFGMPYYRSKKDYNLKESVSVIREFKINMTLYNNYTIDKKT